MLFSSFSRVGLNLMAKRFARKPQVLKSWPNDWVPFIWNRPVKIPGYLDTGDLVAFREATREEIRSEAKQADELIKLDPDDPIHKVFSTRHAGFRDQRKTFIDQMLNEMGLIHKVDFSNSLEAKIVSLTFTLRSLIGSVKDRGPNKYNIHARKIANNLKNRRNRYLCELKEMHAERYERMLDVLSIEPVKNSISMPYDKPFRKVQMRKLAIQYAQDLKEKKVKEFMLSLEKEKAEFEEHKKKTLKWIEEQETKLGIKV